MILMLLMMVSNTPLYNLRIVITFFINCRCSLSMKVEILLYLAITNNHYFDMLDHYNPNPKRVELWAVRVQIFRLWFFRFLSARPRAFSVLLFLRAQIVICRYIFSLLGLSWTIWNHRSRQIFTCNSWKWNSAGKALFLFFTYVLLITFGLREKEEILRSRQNFTFNRGRWRSTLTCRAWNSNQKYLRLDIFCATVFIRMQYFLL